MAVTGNQASHRYKLKAGHPGSGYYWIRWDTNGIGDPDNQIGDTGEITVIRVSKNTYGIAFAHRWARVVFAGMPVVLNAPNLLLPQPKAEGYATANGASVVLVDETLTLEAVESDGKTCEACFILSGRT